MVIDRERDDVGSLVGRYRAAVSPLRAFLKELHARHTPLRDGRLTDYIPELTKAARPVKVCEELSARYGLHVFSGRDAKEGLAAAAGRGGET